MKVLFILDNLSLGQEPLGIMYLSAALKAAGHETTALNSDSAGESLVEQVRKVNPGLIAFSSTTGLHREHLALADRLKAGLQVPIIMGNAHPTFFPEVLEESKSLDFICRGEGEAAIVELVDALEGRGDPAKIRNIDARIGDKIIRNPLRPFNEDLDALAFPDRDLTNGFNPLFVEGTSHFVSGRGCPYDCSFCFNHAARSMAEGHYVRRRSVDSVLREVREVCTANRARLVNFQDDTFISNRNWLEEFAARYPKEVGLPYLCHVRANLMTPQVGKWLAESGCAVVCMGVEAGNDYIRNKILSRNLSREQILRAGRILHENGIHIVTQNMVGVPFETTQTFWETLDLNRQCAPEVMQICIFKPHPRQKITQIAQDAGVFDGDFEALPSTFFERLSLNLRDREELEAMFRCANLALDSRLIRLFMRLLRLLPRNNGLKLRALRWLGRHQNGLRRRLGCRDSRWAPLNRYWAPAGNASARGPAPSPVSATSGEVSRVSS